MKKLMTVIAAVAMSFGLFADEPAAKASHFISFEAADKCVDQDGKLVKTGWTGDASVIGLVDGYNYSGADARRDATGEPGFDGGTENTKCLKLETGSNQVVCAPGGDTDDIYFDQTVKFTGYEEAPTVTDGKIAVWMSAIETEGTEGEDGYIAGETNLYVTCAKVNAAGVATPTNICIGAYDIDAWHRVTIKSLGDIADSVPRAGFLVYIDGAQVGSFEGIAAIGGLQEKFQSYSTSGLLFPALDADDATVTAVAYQGIGELDDVAIDNLGPQFARFVEGTVAAINGATLALTNLTDMTEVTVDSDGKFQVAPNSSLLFTYTAIQGNFLTGGKETATATGNIGETQEFDFNDEIESKTKVATYGDDSGDEFFAASIQEAVNADESGVVMLLTDTALTDMLVVPASFGGGELIFGKNTITLAADKAIGIDIQADGVTIIGGTIASALTENVAGSKAINIPNVNVDLSGTTINAAHYEWVLYANCDEACKEAGDDEKAQLAWFYTDTEEKFAELNCEGVSITGNGSLFHVEGMTANLTDCSATKVGDTLFGAAHQAAVYSSLNSLTTISGSGTYTHVNALQSGNLGGKIVVDEDSEAVFTGNIKSFMKVGAHTELEDLTTYPGYKAQFTFNAGTYDGEIVFVDNDARELDSFWKAEAVEINAPAGYKWDEDGYLVPCDYVVTLSWDEGANKESFESAAEAFSKIGDLQKQGVLWVTANFLKDDATYPGYKFYKDSIINIDGQSEPGFCIWDIEGNIDCTVGVENKKWVNVHGGTLTFAGLIKSGAKIVAADITVADAKIELSLAAANGENASYILTKTALDVETDFVNIPEGYKVAKTPDINDYFRYELAALETWKVTIGSFDTTQVESLTADPMEVREDAASKMVTLTATFKDGYALDYYTVDGEQISGDTFEISADTTVGVVAMKTAVEPVKPGDEKTVNSYEEAVNMPIQAADDAAEAAGQVAVLKKDITDNGDNTYTVKVDINTAATAFVKPEVAVEELATDLSDIAAGETITLDLSDATKFTPGLYYSVDTALELGAKSEFVEGDRVLAGPSGATLTVTKPDGATTKAFFKVSEHMTATPANKD